MLRVTETTAGHLGLVHPGVCRRQQLLALATHRGPLIDVRGVSSLSGLHAALGVGPGQSHMEETISSFLLFFCIH